MFILSLFVNFIFVEGESASDNENFLCNNFHETKLFFIRIMQRENFAETI